MLGAVIGIFAVCWLPYLPVYFMYSFFDPSIMKAWYTPHMFLAFFWLAMAIGHWPTAVSTPWSTIS
jgi:hypothetical protein